MLSRYRRAACSPAAASAALGDPVGSRSPCRYRTAIAETRLTRLPRLFARSTLYRSSYRSHEKSPSPPNVISFARYSRKGSGPKRAATASGIDHRAERLAHALTVDGHEPMAEDLTRQRQLCRHQHGRPDHGVEAGDVLADHVKVGRPPGLEHRRVGAQADRRRVVDQRVEPDVHHARRVEGQRDAPGLPRAAHGDILEPALQQPEDFVAANFRLRGTTAPGQSDPGVGADISRGGRSSSSR